MFHLSVGVAVGQTFTITSELRRITVPLSLFKDEIGFRAAGLASTGEDTLGGVVSGLYATDAVGLVGVDEDAPYNAKDTGGNAAEASSA